MASCRQEINAKGDCFATKTEGNKKVCRILIDTNLKRDCPFYKTIQEYLEGNPTSDLFFDEAGLDG